MKIVSWVLMILNVLSAILNLGTYCQLHNTDSLLIGLFNLAVAGVLLIQLT